MLGGNVKVPCWLWQLCFSVEHDNFQLTSISVSAGRLLLIPPLYFSANFVAFESVLSVGVSAE